MNSRNSRKRPKRKPSPTSRRRVKHWEIVNDLYRFRIDLRVGGGLRDASIWAGACLGRECPPLENCPYTAGRVFVWNTANACVWFPEKPTVSILVHEAGHILANVAEERGFPALNFNTSEPYCYLLDWITREIANRVW